MQQPADRPPSLEAIVETAIYVADLERAEAFYRDVLGLPLLGKEEGRHVFFSVGEGVLLVFKPETTREGAGFPAHGATGPGHFALGIPTESLDAWKQWLLSQGIAIEHEIDWPRGGHSVYFRDPDGNSAELVTRGVWGRPSGW